MPSTRGRRAATVILALAILSGAGERRAAADEPPVVGRPTPEHLAGAILEGSAEELTKAAGWLEVGSREDIAATLRVVRRRVDERVEMLQAAADGARAVVQGVVRMSPARRGGVVTLKRTLMPLDLQPAALLRVMLDPARRGQVAPDGRYSIAGVRPGTYAMELRLDEVEYVGPGVTVPGAGTVTRDLVLGDSRVEVRVAHPDGRPAAGVDVELLSNRRVPLARARTDGAGRISVGQLPGGWLLAQATNGGLGLPVWGRVFASREVVNRLDLRLQVGGWITVWVVDAQRRLVPGVQVRLERPDLQISYVSATDERGVMRERVAPGPWLLRLARDRAQREVVVAEGREVSVELMVSGPR
jgi:hypothetical protein